MSETSLYDLGMQYMNDIDRLDEMIADCKERKHQAWLSHNSTEVARLEQLTELHILQRNDLVKIAAHLRRYYNIKPRGST